MFKENRAGATPAIQYWYFPGEKIGKEFIYSKEQAEKMASLVSVFRISTAPTAGLLPQLPRTP